jgi:hypothetical protein
MLKKLMQSAVALLLVLGIVAASSQDAQARRRGSDVAAGIIIGTFLGLGLSGAYAELPPYYEDDYDGPPPRYYGGPPPRHYEGPACYPGPRRCGYVDRKCWHNKYGERVCRGGKYRCWRERICD